ncbi:hypothetical protein [Vallitalea guaymasensis]|uniref:DUF6848 family protein n=1 Tax=Vallitalea guaymasensis TaxID=1185412 RepID=UPI000DE3792F|nr:hypothetical protein [Vallitalea guaymasensis]
MKNTMNERLTQEKKEELKDKYGKVYEITATVEDYDSEEEQEITFVFKKPKAVDYDRLIKNAGKKPSQAFKNLTISTIIDEQKEAYEEAVKELPGLPSSYAQKLLSILGVSDTVNFKQL